MLQRYRVRRCTKTAAIAIIAILGGCDEPIVDALQRKDNNGKLEPEGSKQEK
jgi:hypothetical protein